MGQGGRKKGWLAHSGKYSVIACFHWRQLGRSLGSTTAAPQNPQGTLPQHPDIHRNFTGGPCRVPCHHAGLADTACNRPADALSEPRPIKAALDLDQLLLQADGLHVAIKLRRIGDGKPVDAITVMTEKGDRRFVLRMGFKPDGFEITLQYLPFDIRKQEAAYTPALKIRIDPEIGNRLVEMFPCRPSGNRAPELGHADGKPGRAGEIGKGTGCVIVKRRGNAERRCGLPPRPEADGCQNLRFLLLRIANDDQAAPSMADRSKASVARFGQCGLDEYQRVPVID